MKKIFIWSMVFEILGICGLLWMSYLQLAHFSKVTDSISGARVSIVDEKINLIWKALAKQDEKRDEFITKNNQHFDGTRGRVVALENVASSIQKFYLQGFLISSIFLIIGKGLSMLFSYREKMEQLLIQRVA